MYVSQILLSAGPYELDFQIASIFEEAWAPQYTYIGIILDDEAIRKLQVASRFYDRCSIYLWASQLELTIDDVKWAIVNAKKLKIKQEVSVPLSKPHGLGVNNVLAIVHNCCSPQEQTSHLYRRR